MTFSGSQSARLGLNIRNQPAIKNLIYERWPGVLEPRALRLFKKLFTERNQTDTLRERNGISLSLTEFSGV